MMRRRAALAFGAPAAGLWLALLLAPLLILLRVSLYAGGARSGFGIGATLYEPGTWTLSAYAQVLGDPVAREVALFTLLLGIGVTALCLALGLPLALFIAALRPWPRRLATAAVLLPKLANLLVLIYGLKLLLGDDGLTARLLSWVLGRPVSLLYATPGVVIGVTMLVLPYTVIVLLAARRAVDERLLAAAASLGASPWQRLRWVVLPGMRPGIVAAGAITLTWSLGAFVSPFLLGNPEHRTLSVDIQRQAFEYLAWPRAAAESVLGLLMTAACVGLLALAGRWGAR